MIQSWQIYAVGAVAVVGIAWMHGYGTGRSLEAQEFSEYKTKVESAQQVLQAENERIRRQYDDVSKNAATGFEAAKSAHAAGAGRIRVQQCASGRPEVPAPATVTGEPGSTPTESGHSATINVARCEEIANRAVMDAAQVLHLQAWYESMRAASGLTGSQ